MVKKSMTLKDIFIRLYDVKDDFYRELFQVVLIRFLDNQDWTKYLKENDDNISTRFEYQWDEDCRKYFRITFWYNHISFIYDQYLDRFRGYEKDFAILTQVNKLLDIKVKGWEKVEKASIWNMTKSLTLKIKEEE